MSNNQITLSPTRIRRWTRCKKTYYWRYHRHLVKVSRSVPPTLGNVVGATLAHYYRTPPEGRNISMLMGICLEASLFSHSKEFLESGPHQEKLKEWESIVKISKAILPYYHDWAVPRDTFTVAEVETSRKVELTPNVHLLAIPDAVVEVREGIKVILEHKLRSKYRTGDFGIDFQSVGSCMVSDSIGTYYNVINYRNLKYIREPIMRSDEELDYFRNMFIHIGEDILATPPDRCYPSPMKRCTCDYWELCNGEMQGLDMDDIINNLYMVSRRPETPTPDRLGGD